jgi:hypothetical protein
MEGFMTEPVVGGLSPTAAMLAPPLNLARTRAHICECLQYLYYSLCLKI